MINKTLCKLTPKQKSEIAENLIRALTTDEPLSRESDLFVTGWAMSGPEGKQKEFFDVWEMVLSNYMPLNRPTLYRSCSCRKDGVISSFTGSILCANKFGEGCGFLLICDTKQTLDDIPQERQGEYQHTFFPLNELIQKEANKQNSPISRSFAEKYAKEDEYVMRTNLNWMYSLRWVKDGE